MNLAEITRIQAEADLIYSPAEVEAAIEKMSREITAVLEDKNPIILCLMIGGVVPTGKLLPLLNFPLQVEYVHATRYRGETNGGTLHWIRKPSLSLQDRHVLIVDDILDEGNTLAAMVEECKNNQAKTIQTAVLADKQLDRERSFIQADFTGVKVPNRYVFGYGMDYKEYLRNAPGIYAVKGL
ncbi:MAG: hypoxanthine-guanine phosphoribosyltransferase [Gammaproteobacteria bacterium]|nr:hypoxanthine-guanine phosphoribosyltransferase [Gammaproteobacteria bacterium]